VDTVVLRDNQIAVLVVDDHPLFRAGICDRIQSVDDSIVVVGEAGSGSEACEQIAVSRPAVVLMDIAMPGMNGIEATRIIARSWPEVAVIILSVYDDDQYVQAALTAGAAGYLLKTVDAAELRESIRQVARGGSVLSPAVMRSVLGHLSGAPAQPAGLSERERQVLELVAQGAANKAIAKELLLSTRTVEAHLRNIFDKLGATSRTEAVTSALRMHTIRLPDAS
jgi:two-component system, NarL family, nitrate/nitrite response regulator NarL